MSADKAYPLHWPQGWPRSTMPASSKFGDRTPHQALAELTRQLEMLKATGIVISSNVVLGNASPKDKGVCVYFVMKGKPYALPCDKWNRVEDNIWALAKHVEALRGQERWGVGTVERAFAGYMALPAAAATRAREWFAVLGFDGPNISLAQAREQYRVLAPKCHPDTGGSHEAMAELNAAWATAQQKLS